MRSFALLAFGMMLTIPMSGCMDVFGGEPEGRVWDFTLEVKPGSGEAIPLYTLNDGSQMNVVAMGFSVPGQGALTVPNPEIRVQEGDTVRLTIENNSPLAHTFHLHGGLIPWEMDGVPYFTQEPIQRGESYTYVFEDLKAGTYMYHCHVDVAHHIDLGMYGAFIVEERDPDIDFDRDYTLLLDEWDNCHTHNNQDPLTGSEQSGEFSARADCLGRFLQDNLAQNQLANLVRQPICAQNPPPEVAQQLQCGSRPPTPPQQSQRDWYPVTHPVYNPEYNTYLINGKAFPDTAPMIVSEGETIKVRLGNIGEELHSMHIHGHYMLVTHRDGYPLEHPYRVDTLGLMPGERYDVIIKADNPGFWVFHDHVGLNVMNDHHAPGGMLTCIAYDGFKGIDTEAFTRSIDCVDSIREHLPAPA